MKKVYLLLVFTFAIQLDGQNIYTFAGTGISGFSGDGGQALSAQLYRPKGMASDAAGNIYFCDSQNNRIRKIDASGIITTIAGGGTLISEGISALSTSVKQPACITLDASGNIYYTETFNPRLRKINTSGIVNTIAGNGSPGFAGDGGPATSAKLNTPEGIALDLSGNIYVADNGNNRIRMISTTGTISTIAGTGANSYSGDGGLATLAQLNFPSDVKTDASGNIYICDNGNSRIRMINAVGTITTIAGGGGFGYSGDGGPAASAQIGKPLYFAFDISGNIYFDDGWNGLIRKINPSGIISTIAGTGIFGYSGDGGPANLAQLDNPAGITLDGIGNIYLCEYNKAKIRMICVSSCPLDIEENSLSGGLKIFPNPASSILTISSEQNTFENSEIEIANYLGQNVLKLPFTKTVDVANLAQGMYTVKISSAKGQTLTKKFVKD